jgi:hypothetical protein
MSRRQIPLPPGALSAGDWDVDDTRSFRGSARGRIEIWGRQHASGRVLRRDALVGEDNISYDSASLRALARDAIATADELDALSYNE